VDFFNFDKFDGPWDGVTLKDSYEKEVELQILGFVTRLKADLKKNDDIQLDFLQLSGKSSIIPLVRQLFRKEFEESGTEVSVLDSNQLKECVVSGACLWTQMNGGISSVQLSTPDSFNITTSRLGLLDSTASRFEPIIPLCHLLGKPVDRPGYQWRSKDTSILIHESLAETDNEVAEEDLQVHSFVPETAGLVGSDQILTLSLCVGVDYQPVLSAILANGKQILFRQEPDQER
jgi:hypothetical protein